MNSRNFVANLIDEMKDAMLDDNQSDNDSIGTEVIDSAEDANEVQRVDGNTVESEGGGDDTCYDEPLAINEQIFDIPSE
jgi:hypothetical protein